MSKDLVLSNNEANFFSNAKKWCGENQWAVGVGEIAVGAGLIAWGVKNDAIKMGTQLVATQLDGSNVESLVGAISGGGIGAIAGAVIGSIGVAGLGGAIGIPASIVIGGASSVLSMAGYVAGDITHNITSSLDIESFVGSGCLLTVGLALLIDGSRRVINDPKVLKKLSSLKEKTIKLTELASKTIISTKEELDAFIKKYEQLPNDKKESFLKYGKTGAGAGLFAGMGAGIGAVGATSTVTVLGSSTLGGAALSLGLVSAPVWPIAVGAIGGLGLGYAGYRAVKKYKKNKRSESSNIIKSE